MLSIDDQNDVQLYLTHTLMLWCYQNNNYIVFLANTSPATDTSSKTSLQHVKCSARPTQRVSVWMARYIFFQFRWQLVWFKSFCYSLQPYSEEHQIGILTIKTPSANRRCLESNNGSKKSYDDLSPYLGPGQRAHSPHQQGPSPWLWKLMDHL